MPDIAQIDPMCESKFGHNIGLNSLFFEQFKNAGFSVDVHASKGLPLDARGAAHFRRVLPSIISNFQGEEATVNGLARFFQRTPARTLFFPNVDRFSLKAMAQNSAVLREKKLLVRLIAVGECFFHGQDQRYEDGYCPNRFEHFEDMKRIADHCDVRFCSESIPYKQLIEAKTQLHCDHWPIPPQTSIAETLEAPAIRDVVYFPGTPRWDKGSIFVDDMTRKMAARHPELTFAFQTDRTSLEIDNNRIFLPKLLDKEEYLHWLNKSLCVVLPYNSEIYRFRGSASVCDAADINVGIITLTDLGFSQEIIESGIGLVYKNLDSLATLDIREACDGFQSDKFGNFNAKRAEALRRQIDFLNINTSDEPS